MGLNGHEAPVIVLPPKSLARGTTLLGDEPTYLKVNIPQPTPEGQEPKAPPYNSLSSPIQMPSPIKAPPPKAEREVSMTMEVRELLSRAVLCIWTCVRELNPKETKSHGHTYTSAP